MEGRMEGRMAEERTLLVGLVNLVLMVALAEAAWLLWRGRRAGRPAGPLLANLGAGLALMLALRLVLADLAWPWVAACLAGAGLAHGLDLRARWASLGSARRAAEAEPAALDVTGTAVASAAASAAAASGRASSPPSY
jgi:hypothetical protein